MRPTGRPQELERWHIHAIALLQEGRFLVEVARMCWSGSPECAAMERPREGAISDNISTRQTPAPWPKALRRLERLLLKDANYWYTHRPHTDVQLKNGGWAR